MNRWAAASPLLLAVLLSLASPCASASSPIASLMLASPLLESPPSETGPASMSEAADLVLHAMGLPSHVDQSGATQMPATNIFSRPRLGVMFVVDGTQADAHKVSDVLSGTAQSPAMVVPLSDEGDDAGASFL